MSKAIMFSNIMFENIIGHNPGKRHLFDELLLLFMDSLLMKGIVASPQRESLWLLATRLVSMGG